MRRTASWSAVLAILLVAGCDDSGGLTVEQRRPQVDALFGLARADAPTTKTLTIAKPFVPPATVEVVQTTGPFEPAPGQLPGAAAAGILYDIDVVFTPPPPTAPGGTPITGTITLRYVKVDGTLATDLDLNLTASVEEPQASLETNTISFGRVAIGEKPSGILRINNPNTVTPITIQTIVLLADPEFALGLSTTSFPFDILPGDDLGIPIIYAPTGLGTDSGSVTVAHNVGGALVANLSGAGMPGEVVLYDSTVMLDTNGESGLIAIDVPPEAVSLAIWCSVPFFEDINIIHFEGPSGFVYTLDDFSGPWFWYEVWPNGFNGNISAQLPNSDAGLAQLRTGGGTYLLEVSDIFWPNGIMDIRVTAELRAGVPAKGTLDLNVYLADGLGISVADAPKDTRLQKSLQLTDQILGQVGLRVGDVEYHVITDPSFDFILDGSHLEFLFRDGPFLAASPSPADRFGPLNLFYINDFAEGHLGESGAITGPRLEFDSIYNGVAVAYDSQDPVTLGLTVAHEIGHFLALLHTVEDNGVFDIIEDTAQCPIGDVSEECPVIGNDNLLYPYDIGPQAANLTPGQGRVILRHAHVSPGHPDTFFSSSQLTGNVPEGLAATVLASNLAGCRTCAKQSAGAGKR
jgi:hypothetical protein